MSRQLQRQSQSALGNDDQGSKEGKKDELKGGEIAVLYCLLRERVGEWVPGMREPWRTVHLCGPLRAGEFDKLGVLDPLVPCVQLFKHRDELERAAAGQVEYDPVGWIVHLGPGELG